MRQTKRAHVCVCVRVRCFCHKDLSNELLLWPFDAIPLPLESNCIGHRPVFYGFRYATTYDVNRGWALSCLPHNAKARDETGQRGVDGFSTSRHGFERGMP